MNGPSITVRTLCDSRPFGPSRRSLQYHPRSDHHSKVSCWCIAFDLLLTSSLLRSHVSQGKVCIGVNHEMIDFKSSRKKVLDLVIGRPSHDGAEPEGKVLTLADVGRNIGVRLTAEQCEEFSALPTVAKRPVGPVLVALEAKAAATEHGKAESRMFDELNSSQATVHGAADQAIAVGLAIVNIADTFFSPLRIYPEDGPPYSVHDQPEVSASLIAKLRQLPRRSGPGSEGFDALGIMLIELHNDGTPVKLYNDLPAPQPDDSDTYAAMVLRAASLYDYRFSAL